MTHQIKNHVPDLLKKRGETMNDLMHGTRISRNTAVRWSASPSAPDFIDSELLTKFCEYFQCPITGIIEIVTPS